MSGPEKKKLTGVMRAAILLAHLDTKTAEQVIKALNRKEIKRLSASSRDLIDVSREEVTQVLESFVAQAEASNPALQAGAAGVAKLAFASLGSDEQEALDEGISGLTETLSDVDPRTIGNLLRKEHPQTTALVLAHLDPKRCADVMGYLPETLQSDVLRRLASIDQVSPDVIKTIEDVLSGELAQMGKGPTRKVGGINLVADIMNRMEKSKEQVVMKRLEEEDGKLAEEVRAKMFVFEDLIHVDNKGIQTLLKEVERETLIVALKAADEDLKQHIFKNLSARAAQMIVEEMESRGPMRLSDVEKAQADIVRVALPLQASGAITVSKGGSDAFV